MAGDLEVRDAVHRAKMAGYRVKMNGAGSDDPVKRSPNNRIDEEKSFKKMVQDFTRNVGDQSNKTSSYARQKPWGHGGQKLSFVSRPNHDPDQLGWGAYDLKDPI